MSTEYDQITDDENLKNSILHKDIENWKPMESNHLINALSNHLIKALLEVQKTIGGVQKGGRNTFKSYNYAKLEDYYNACKSALNEQGVIVYESVVEHSFIEGRMSKPKQGETDGAPQYCARVMIELTMIHELGGSLTIRCCGEGQDDQDKATYKAITGARKYAIAMAMNLVTTDDPEKDEPSGNRRPASSSEPVSTSAKAMDF